MNSGCLAVFDLDGTITRRDTLAPFLWGFLWRRPWRLPRLLLVLPAAARFLIDRDRGAIKGAVIHAALGGARRASIERWAERFVAGLLQRALYAEALGAIATHRARGDRLLLMSASTDLYVPRIARALGFDETICSEVRWRADGRLDGRLATANCRGEEKRRCLAAVIARDAPGRVCAYGDSRADLIHMQLVQEAYLVNVSARLAGRQRAQVLHWHQPGGL
ncbi:MAG: HAD-IB family hydrolase [Steroidobacterales bacterium]